MGKPLPDGGEHTTGTAPLTKSTAVGFTKPAALPVALFASKVAGDGTFANPGGVVSTTVTVKFAFAGLFAASLAVQFTVVGPSGNVFPDAGVHETVGFGSTLSTAETLNETAAPPGPVASAI